MGLVADANGGDGVGDFYSYILPTVVERRGATMKALALDLFIAAVATTIAWLGSRLTDTLTDSNIFLIFLGYLLAKLSYRNTISHYDDY